MVTAAIAALRLRGGGGCEAPGGGGGLGQRGGDPGLAGRASAPGCPRRLSLSHSGPSRR